MWLYVSGKSKAIDDQTLGKLYNVEYKLGNGKSMTLSSTLTNICDKYYWFLDNDGMCVIQKDRIVTMVCMSSICVSVDKRNLYQERVGDVALNDMVLIDNVENCTVDCSTYIGKVGKVKIIDKLTFAGQTIIKVKFEKDRYAYFHDYNLKNVKI